MIGSPRRAASFVALAAALLGAACTPEGGGTTPSTTVGPTTTTTTTTSTTTPTGDDAFTVVFVGDSEPRMRGNTDDELRSYIANLASYRTTKEAYFAYDGGRYRISPELVILGGDISADRDTSVAKDMPLWQQLYDRGIAFVAGFGNHDWDPAVWSDGSLGYSVAGHESNNNTVGFTRATYQRSAQLTPAFTYQEFMPTSAHGPVTFAARYKGVAIANFNTFLYHPSYRYPDGWPLTCNLLGGGAGCQTFVSAEAQIQRLEAALPADPTVPTLFVQHYPVSSQSWWDDAGASGTTFAQKRDRLFDLMARSDRSLLLTAHDHVSSQRTHDHDGETLREVTAPYFGGANGDDRTQGGGFVAVLVSGSRGILEVKVVPGGN